MGRASGVKLSAEQRKELSRLIVSGFTLPETNREFESRGWEPISDVTWFNHRRHPETAALLQEANQLARSSGIANRLRMVEHISRRILLYSHRAEGTSPLREDVFQVDPAAEVVKVSTEEFIAITREEQKWIKMLYDLTSDSVSKKTTIEKRDGAGHVQGITTIEAEGEDSSFAHIASMAQDNDALEAALEKALQIRTGSTVTAEVEGVVESPRLKSC